jgi:thiamine biosynthesis protein ThiS
MRVILNGEPQDLNEGLTVSQLVEQLRLNGRRIAVEINRAILARDDYAVRALHAGDEIEIVHFIGGG